MSPADKNTIDAFLWGLGLCFLVRYIGLGFLKAFFNRGPIGHMFRFYLKANYWKHLNKK